MRVQRRGSAGLKVLGCWVLFIGGAVVGLMAMGHRPEELFDAILAKTTGVVLDQMAERGMVPTPPEGTDLSAVDINAQVAALQQQLQQSQQNSAHPSSTQASKPLSGTKPQSVLGQAPARKPTRNSNSKKAARGEATLDYWNQVNSVIAREGEMRSAPSDVNAGNAGGFVSSRLRAYRYAATALHGLRHHNVDPEVVAHVQRLVDWYEEGTEINQDAMHLLTEASPEQRRGAAGRNWKESEKAHYETVQRLNQQGSQLQQRMTQRYGIEFPPML